MECGQRQRCRGDSLVHAVEELPLAERSSVMSDVIVLMTTKRFGCAGIVDADGALIGVITDGDLRRNMGDRLLAESAGDVMTGGARTIGPDALASEALAIMNSLSITNLFVVEDGVPVGSVHIHDCLRAGVVAVGPIDLAGKLLRHHSDLSDDRYREFVRLLSVA